MGRFGAWLWRKHPRYFVEWLAAGASAFFGVFLAMPSVAVAGVYLDMRATEIAIWGAALAAAMSISVGTSLFAIRRRLDPVHAWADGNRGDPRAVWSTLIRVPSWFAACVLSIGFVIDTGISYTAALRLAEPEPAGVWGLLYAYVLVHLIAGVYFASCVQLGVRPAIVEVSALLPSTGREPLSWWTIRRRLLLGCFGGIAITAYVTPMIILGGAAEQSDYLVAGLGGCVLAGYIGWLLNAGMIRPTVLPVQDLMRGTIRVRRGDIGTPVPVASHDELGELAAAFNEMQRGLQERESLQTAFGSYVDPLLAQRLLESGSSVFEGEEIDVTVLFADVRDFTSYAERVAPGEAVGLLNTLFDVIVPLVHEAGGHTNHYLGDGLLAVFGAPQPLPDHAAPAVAAAIAIQRSVKEKFGDDLRLCIGVNSGSVIAGTVGGGGRHEFTVIGDTVNVAARVEQLTKETGDAILVTAATHALVDGSPGYSADCRGEFEVRGKSQRVTLHSVAY